MQSRDLVGRKYEEVVMELKAEGQMFRVCMQDGQLYAGTCDMQPTRLNFGVKEGIITSVSFG